MTPAILPFLAISAAAPVLSTCLAAALLIATWRLVRGPTLVDRVVALDVVASIAVGIFLIAAIDRGQPALVDVALLVALVSFIALLAFSRYLGRESRRA